MLAPTRVQQHKCEFDDGRRSTAITDPHRRDCHADPHGRCFTDAAGVLSAKTVGRCLHRPTDRCHSSRDRVWRPWNARDERRRGGGEGGGGTVRTVERRYKTTSSFARHSATCLRGVRGYDRVRPSARPGHTPHTQTHTCVHVYKKRDTVRRIARGVRKE